jgi:hypothetical protein
VPRWGPETVVRALAVSVAVEGGALALGSAIYAGFIVAGSPHNRGLALFGASLGLLAGTGLLLAARGLARRRRAATSPVVLFQIIAIPVGIGLIQGGRPLIAVGVLAPAVATLGGLFGSKAGRELFTDAG